MDRDDAERTQLASLVLTQGCTSTREAALKWAMQEFLLSQHPQLYPEYPEFVVGGATADPDQPSARFFSFLYNLLLANASSAGAELKLSEADIERGWREFHSPGFDHDAWQADFQLFQRLFLVAASLGGDGDATLFDYLKWVHQFTMFTSDGGGGNLLALPGLVDGDSDEDDSDEDPDYLPAAFGLDDLAVADGPLDPLVGHGLLRPRRGAAAPLEFPGADGALGALGSLDDGDDAVSTDDDDDDQTAASPTPPRARPQDPATAIAALDACSRLQSEAHQRLAQQVRDLRQSLAAARALARQARHRASARSRDLARTRQLARQLQGEMRQWRSLLSATTEGTHFRRAVPDELPTGLSQEQIGRIALLGMFQWVKEPGRRRIFNASFQLRVVDLLRTYGVSRVDAPLFLQRTLVLWCGFVGTVPSELTVSHRTFEGRTGWLAQHRDVDAGPLWAAQALEYQTAGVPFNWTWQGLSGDSSSSAKRVRRAAG